MKVVLMTLAAAVAIGLLAIMSWTWGFRDYNTPAPKRTPIAWPSLPPTIDRKPGTGSISPPAKQTEPYEVVFLGDDPDSGCTRSAAALTPDEAAALAVATLVRASPEEAASMYTSLRVDLTGLLVGLQTISADPEGIADHLFPHDRCVWVVRWWHLKPRFAAEFERALGPARDPAPPAGSWIKVLVGDQSRKVINAFEEWNG